MMYLKTFKPKEIIPVFQLKFYTKAALLFLTMLACFNCCYSQTAEVDTNMWVANGGVLSFVKSNNTIYLGGNFTYVGPNTGNGVPVNTTTGEALSSFPKVSGSVFASVADGSGGWYIGGSFTSVGGIARNRLAHILADSTLDPNWNPDSDNQIIALLLSGNTLHVLGTFTSICGANQEQNSRNWCQNGPAHQLESGSYTYIWH
jgi:hypothetical protein